MVKFACRTILASASLHIIWTVDSTLSKDFTYVNVFARTYNHKETMGWLNSELKKMSKGSGRDLLQGSLMSEREAYKILMAD